MDRYQVIENRKHQVYYVIDRINGKCLLETENLNSALKKKFDLNDENALFKSTI